MEGPSTFTWGEPWDGAVFTPREAGMEFFLASPFGCRHDIYLSICR
jgi:hypothetical protein